MKLVKSLLLSSAAGLAAVASAQAADLPFRKAAPVEYVRVCDFTGAGYFYIPGSDTCLKVGGYVRADYAYIEPTRAFFPTVITPTATALGTNIPGRLRDGSGFRAEGRIDVDTRTQTAYGTLRAYVRLQADAAGGNFASNPAGAAVSPAGTGFLGSSSNNSAYVDKAFIQWAGISAGRLQSYFDFYADNYNFEGIANSDQSTELFAYTATFGGGFSATISLEDANARRNNVYNTGFLTSTTTNIFGTTGLLGTGNSLSPTTEGYAGQQIPDIVGNVRLDQAWGAVQISGAYHQVRTVSQDGGFHVDRDGFAVQGGVQIKLPMLAAGDDLWLEGAYQNGAYKYMDSSSGFNQGFNSLLLGGFQHRDADAYAFQNNAAGAYSLSLSDGFSVMGAFHHFFTPTFSTVLFGSYEEVSYGNRAKTTDWRLGGIGDASEYRVGDQLIWTPVNNLSVGLEVIYAHIDQTIAGGAAGRAAVPVGVQINPSAFEGRLRMERDF